MKMDSVRREIKKTRRAKRRGGSPTWPLHVIMLVCELLVDGVPPVRVRATIQTTSAYFRGAKSDELPSTSTIRECRTVIQVLNDVLAALKLAQQPSWCQLCTDITKGRQIAFQCLVIGYIAVAGFQSVIASSSICFEGEKSEEQVAGIEEKVRIR